MENEVNENVQQENTNATVSVEQPTIETVEQPVEQPTMVAVEPQVEAAAPVVENTTSMPEVTAAPVENATAVENTATTVGPVATSNDNSVPTNTTEGKKKNSGVIIGVIVGAVVLILLALFVLPRIFVSSKGVVNKEVSTIFTEVKDVFTMGEKKIMAYDLEKDTLGLTGSLTIDSDYQANGVDFSKLKNYQLNYGGVIDKKGNQASVNLGLAKGSSDILAMNGYIKGKEMVIDLGDLYAKAIGTTLETEIKDLDLSKTENTEDIKTLLDKTEKIVKNNIKDEDITKSKEEKEINGKKANYTKVTYTIKVQEFTKEVLKAYQEDPEIIKILARLSSKEEKEIKDDLKDSIADLEKTTEQDIVTVDSYLSGTLNEMKELDITSDNASLIIIKENDTYQYQYNVDGKEMFSGEYDKKKETFTLNSDEGFNIKVVNNNDTTNITLDYKDEYQSMNIDATIVNKVESSSQENDITLKLNYQMDDEKINATLKNHMKIEKNVKVEQVNKSDTIDMNLMTDADIDAIYTKLYEKLNAIMQEIAPSLGSNSIADFRLI